MKKIVPILSLFLFWLYACTPETSIDLSPTDNQLISINYNLDQYQVEATMRATHVGTAEEQAIDHLFLFLFPTKPGQTLKTYYIASNVFTGGTRTGTTLSLEMTQAEAGEREVCMVANYSAVDKASLESITSLAALENWYSTAAQPWSEQLKTPILMSSRQNHNFNLNSHLSNLRLGRAVAKIELNISLSSSFQVVPTVNSGLTEEYAFRYVQFDKKSYALLPTSKTPDLASSGWNNWKLLDVVTNVGTGKAEQLHLVTYLNERFEAGAKIDLRLPYNDGGFLPPPEFGDETYTLQLPALIQRNHWYKYDIEL